MEKRTTAMSKTTGAWDWLADIIRSKPEPVIQVIKNKPVPEQPPTRKMLKEHFGLHGKRKKKYRMLNNTLRRYAKEV